MFRWLLVTRELVVVPLLPGLPEAAARCSLSPGERFMVRASVFIASWWGGRPREPQLVTSLAPPKLV